MERRTERSGAEQSKAERSRIEQSGAIQLAERAQALRIAKQHATNPRSGSNGAAPRLRTPLELGRGGADDAPRLGNIVNEHTERVSAGLSRARDRDTTTAEREHGEETSEREKEKERERERLPEEAATRPKPYVHYA